MAVMKDPGKAPGIQEVETLADDLGDSKKKQQLDSSARTAALEPLGIFSWSSWCVR